jgi:hypothetical protein
MGAEGVPAVPSDTSPLSDGPAEGGTGAHGRLAARLRPDFPIVPCVRQLAQQVPLLLDTLQSALSTRATRKLALAWI